MEKVGLNLPEWEKVSYVGNGVLGDVYRAERRTDEGIEVSAIRVISVPSDESEIIAMKEQGLDDIEIASTLVNCVAAIVKLIDADARTFANTNIVNCEVIKTVQIEDGFGLSVYVQMPFLTPVIAMDFERFNVRDVIKLGQDICKALVVLDKNCRFHGFMDLNNIYIDDNGNYLLSNPSLYPLFEDVYNDITEEILNFFMPPEKVLKGPASIVGDVYSLGLMMYCLLDKKFYSTAINASRKNPFFLEKQVKKSMGMDLPMLAVGNEKLSRIIHKACSYNKEDRYQHPEEMLRDLASLDVSSINQIVPEADETDIPEEPELLELTEEEIEPVLKVMDEQETSSFSDEAVNSPSIPFTNEMPVILEDSLIDDLESISQGATIVEVEETTTKVVAVAVEETTTKVVSVKIDGNEVEETSVPAELTLSNPNQIGKEEFANNTELVSVIIPDGVRTISNGAFKGCVNMTDVVIPESVTSIGNEAFRGCKSLKTVKIPLFVTRIGNEAFYDCDSLTQAIVSTRLSTKGMFWSAFEEHTGIVRY